MTEVNVTARDQIGNLTVRAFVTMALLDPSIIFTIFVVLCPLVKVPNFDAAVTYLTNPTLLSAFALLAAVIYFTRFSKSGREHCVHLSDYDTRVANWFLCNGVFYNLFLDVFAGQFQMMGEMSVQYLAVEPRYLSGLHDDAGSVVFMTSMMELFFQSPLCILAYWSIHRKKPYRWIIQIIVSLLHTSGVWYFYVTEAIRGFPHLDEDSSFSFSFDYILYYWFGFWFCGLLWIVVPWNIAWAAGKEITQTISSVENKGQKEKAH